MITYAQAKKLLHIGDIVFAMPDYHSIVPARVAEIQDGWLETDIGVLDFEDHRYTWWLTERVAMEQLELNGGMGKC